MTPATLKTEQLSAFTGLPQAVILSALKQAGISAIDTGKGRGRGLRWLTSAVMEVVHTMHRNAQSTKKPHARAHAVIGRRPDDLFAELARETLPQ